MKASCFEVRCRVQQQRGCRQLGHSSLLCLCHKAAVGPWRFIVQGEIVVQLVDGRRDGQRDRGRTRACNMQGCKDARYKMQRCKRDAKARNTDTRDQRQTLLLLAPHQHTANFSHYRLASLACRHYPAVGCLALLNHAGVMTSQQRTGLDWTGHEIALTWNTKSTPGSGATSATDPTPPSRPSTRSSCGSPRVCASGTRAPAPGCTRSNQSHVHADVVVDRPPHDGRAYGSYA